MAESLGAGTARGTGPTLEAVTALYDFLRGKGVPGDMIIPPSHRPKINADRAFAVIYVLQEYLGIVDDQYEKCDRCGAIYDSDEEGMSGIENPDELRGMFGVRVKFISRKWYRKALCGPCLDAVLIEREPSYRKDA